MPHQSSLPVVQPPINLTETANVPEFSTCCTPQLPETSRWRMWSWTRIVLATYLTGMTLVLALVINGTSELDSTTLWTLQIVLMVLTSLVLLLLGPDFIVGTWNAARQGQVSFELLILAAMAGAFLYSTFSVAAGEGAVYFEVIAVLLVIYAVGQRIKKAVHKSARTRAGRLTGQSFAARLLLDDGTTESIPIDQIRAGHRVLVFPGKMIPVDGKITSGRALIREAALTGESVPASRQTGDRVFASTICIDGTLTIEASCDGDQRAVDRIRRAVDQARRQPSATENLTQQIARWFLPFVALAALLTAAYWATNATWDRALMYASAVLLVACPCALGLATPVAIWAALSELASLGIVSKHGDAISALASTDLICFDKTGTLTAPQPALHQFKATMATAYSPDEIKSIVATVERTNEHPVATAIGELANEDPRFQPREIRLLPGRGIQGVVLDRRSAKEIDVEVSRNEQHDNDTLHLVDVSFNGVEVARIELQEHVSGEVVCLMDQLKQLKIRTAIVSGDAQARVESLPADHKLGGLTSAEKREFVQRQRRRHTVAFIGDGFNDAEAMTAADVSLAAAWGTDFAADTADLIWLQKDFSAIIDAIKVCRQAKSIIYSNLLLAAGYNTVGIALAASGWLHPIAAAILMMGSSLTVTLRAAAIQKEC